MAHAQAQARPATPTPTPHTTSVPGNGTIPERASALTLARDIFEDIDLHADTRIETQPMMFSFSPPEPSPIHVHHTLLHPQIDHNAQVDLNADAGQGSSSQYTDVGISTGDRTVGDRPFHLHINMHQHESEGIDRPAFSAYAYGTMKDSVPLGDISAGVGASYASLEPRWAVGERHDDIEIEGSGAMVVAGSSGLGGSTVRSRSRSRSRRRDTVDSFTLFESFDLPSSSSPLASSSSSSSRDYAAYAYGGIHFDRDDHPFHHDPTSPMSALSSPSGLSPITPRDFGLGMASGSGMGLGLNMNLGFTHDDVHLSSSPFSSAGEPSSSDKGKRPQTQTQTSALDIHQTPRPSLHALYNPSSSSSSSSSSDPNINIGDGEHGHREPSPMFLDRFSAMPSSMASGIPVIRNMGYVDIDDRDRVELSRRENLQDDDDEDEGNKEKSGSQETIFLQPQPQGQGQEQPSLSLLTTNLNTAPSLPPLTFSPVDLDPPNLSHGRTIEGSSTSANANTTANTTASASDYANLNAEVLVSQGPPWSNSNPNANAEAEVHFDSPLTRTVSTSASASVSPQELHHARSTSAFSTATSKSTSTSGSASGSGSGSSTSQGLTSSRRPINLTIRGLGWKGKSSSSSSASAGMGSGSTGGMGLMKRSKHLFNRPTRPSLSPSSSSSNPSPSSSSSSGSAHAGPSTGITVARLEGAGEGDNDVSEGRDKPLLRINSVPNHLGTPIGSVIIPGTSGMNGTGRISDPQLADPLRQGLAQSQGATAQYQDKDNIAVAAVAERRSNERREGREADEADVGGVGGGVGRSGLSMGTGTLMRRSHSEPVYPGWDISDVFASSTLRPSLHLSSKASKGKGKATLSPVNVYDTRSLRGPSYSHFDALPSELKLQIFRSILELYQESYEARASDPKWTLARAVSSRERWNGREMGVRGLVRLSRVSKSWRRFILDGQLWSTLDLRSFPTYLSPPSSSSSSKGESASAVQLQALLKAFVQISGPYLRHLDLTGHSYLHPNTIEELVGLIYTPSPSPLSILDPSSLISPSSTSISLNSYRSNTTQLTTLNLKGCTSLIAPSLQLLISHSPSLRKLDLKGLGCVTNSTLEIVGARCEGLKWLDVSWCKGIDTDGLDGLAAPPSSPAPPKSSIASASVLSGRRGLKDLRVLKVAGMREGSRTDWETALRGVGRSMKKLEVLDLSGCVEITDEAVEALVTVRTTSARALLPRPGARVDNDDEGETVVLNSKEAGHEASSSQYYIRRLTSLRHISLSSCPLLTDLSCSYLAHSVSRLEFFEFAGTGGGGAGDEGGGDEGFVRMFRRTPRIRRVDLEDVAGITDGVIRALTPSADKEDDTAIQSGKPLSEQPGHALEELVLSYAANLSNETLLSLIRSCPRLRNLSLDSTRVSQTVVKEFIKLTRSRHISNAEILVVDCRTIGEPMVKELLKGEQTRNRRGWRGYDARKMGYVDARDGEAGVGAMYDECDETRVVFKSFWSWTAVDQARALRKKNAKKRIEIGEGHNGGGEALLDREGSSSGSSSKLGWLGLGRRSVSSSEGRGSPTGTDPEERGCCVM
ncbi:RNI-like protein [Sistotremastrum suecicum HHB10207 ss-3]|uniref:RNI-like protein n=1 Tax=Sistotremastrum suecicum HHB10207 ss-3 TaxID=1314776 RepID=A0A166CLL3_9AGAM|nr:RNI-like protein [Sistotremastrum suecicum HHB10207 ss-3]